MAKSGKKNLSLIPSTKTVEKTESIRNSSIAVRALMNLSEIPPSRKGRKSAIYPKYLDASLWKNKSIRNTSINLSEIPPTFEAAVEKIKTAVGKKKPCNPSKEKSLEKIVAIVSFL